MASLQTAHPPLAKAPPRVAIPDVAPALDVHDLHAAYGQSEVLHGLTFSVAPGEIVAVMGRNGMGKTTLMKTLMGLVPVKSGAIRVEGEAVAGLKSHARVAKGLAYVPQGRMIFSTMTVQENIETGLVVTGKREIPREIFDLFPILAEFEGRRGGNLSGGQQQQLAIARALASDPKVLLLDEPTEGIQPSIIKEIGAVIRTLTKNKMAVLLVEQYYDFAESLADTYAVMARGQITHAGAGSTMQADNVRALISI